MVKSKTGSPGASLIEVVVGMVIASMVFLSVMKALETVGGGLARSRAEDNCRNLADSQINALRNMGYSKLPVSVSSVPIAGISPALYHDPSSYPPETRILSGVPFTIHSLVQKAHRDPSTGELTVVSPDAADRGYRLIQAVVTWRDTKQSLKYSLVKSDLRSSVVGDNTIVSGVVRSTMGVPLSGVWVNTTYAPDTSSTTVPSRTVTDSLGRFRLLVPTDSTYLEVYGNSFYANSLVSGLNVVGNATHDIDASQLTQISHASTTFTVWDINGPKISRIIASTTIAGNPMEYVEIYHGGGNAITFNQLGLKYQRAGDASPTVIDLTYIVNPSFSNTRFALFANYDLTLTILGVSVRPNAVWNSVSGLNAVFPQWAPNRNIILSSADGASEGAGTLILYNKSTGLPLDVVGWNRGATTAPASTGSPIPDPTGIDPGESYARLSSTAGYSTTVGPNYESGNNAVDFVTENPFTNRPRPNSTTYQNLGSGKIVTGVAKLDLNRGDTALGFVQTSTQTLCGSLPCTTITVSSITETYSSPSSYNVISVSAYADSVNRFGLKSIFSFGVPQIITLSSNNAFTACTNKVRFIDELGNPLPNIPYKYSNGFTQLTNGSGTAYIDSRYTVTANAVNSYPSSNVYLINPLYGSVTVPCLGTYGERDVVLPFQTLVRVRTVLDDGATPVSGHTITVSPSAGTTINAVTDMHGYAQFLLPSGTYDFTVPNPTGGVFSPSSWTVGVSAATAGTPLDRTFSLTWISSSINGYLSAGTSSVPGGVLVLAIPSSRPPLGLTEDPPPATIADTFYQATGEADGTYNIDLTTGTYNVYAWRTVMRSGTPEIQRLDHLGVAVTTAPSSVDFQW